MLSNVAILGVEPMLENFKACPVACNASELLVDVLYIY